MIKVLAIDPGITTGYAEGIIKVPGDAMIVGNGQGKWNHLDLYEKLVKFQPDVIVCESFEYRPGLKTESDVIELFSRELIGIVNFYKQQLDRVSGVIAPVLVMQKPAQAVGKKPYFSNERLKAAGVYSTAHPHANDATRHLLHWYEFGPGFKYNKKGIVSA